MTSPQTLVARLRAACDGHPHAKIPWPHRVLREAADRIEALERALQDIEFHVTGGGDIQAIEIIERVLPWEPTNG